MKTKESRKESRKVESNAGSRAVKQDRSDLAKDPGPQKTAILEPAGHGHPEQQAGGPEHHGGDAHEDRNP